MEFYSKEETGGPFCFYKDKDGFVCASLEIAGVEINYPTQPRKEKCELLGEISRRKNLVPWRLLVSVKKEQKNSILVAWE